MCVCVCVCMCMHPLLCTCTLQYTYLLVHSYIMAVRTESAAKSSTKKVIHTQMVFDRSGATVHSKEVVGSLNPGRRQFEISAKHLNYELCLGNRLFTCNKQEG